MFAYVDETGNTGSNIFDKAQPDFFTGALITKSNFDILQTGILQNIFQKHGIQSLHASVLGFGPIEKVSSDILRILKKSDARFFVSRVEKRYLLATKVFDIFFDSGENPAANWAAYNIRPLKLMLCFRVAALLTEEIAHEFWAMLMARNEKAARAKIPKICHMILGRVHLLPDERSKQIVTETLTWSCNHPEALDIFIAGRQAKNGHMPNMVAFVNLLDGLEFFSKKWKSPVQKIIHDRQSQFEGSLKEWHRIFSNASGEPLYRLGETMVLQKVGGSSFDISSSDSSIGIQITDLALWLFRQFLAGKELPSGSAAILNYVFRKGFQNDFSFSGVGSYLESQLRTIMNANISDEALKAGQNLRDHQEKLRKHLMVKYEEDGLMPYQRNIKAPISSDIM